jgi:hypothetical protein
MCDFSDGSSRSGFQTSSHSWRENFFQVAPIFCTTNSTMLFRLGILKGRQTKHRKSIIQSPLEGVLNVKNALSTENPTSLGTVCYSTECTRDGSVWYRMYVDDGHDSRSRRSFLTIYRSIVFNPSYWK